MEELRALEKKIHAIYDEVLRPLAVKTAFELPVARGEAPGLPTVLFLGNHSSGKSSFINHLVGTQLQKTGLAPTDDGFTIITHGAKRDEFDGPTVATHPELAFRRLQELGPTFLSRLRLKTLPAPLLNTISLVDSPGMIDAAGPGNTRGYDFAASVRFFAERADLILFFFDPDKPGTTGETLSIFTDTLAGLNHKLMIILHKVDLFQSIRDFARTYGTLCWNLAKTIKTKDMPHIYNCYLPQTGATPASSAMPWADFDASREEVIAEIQRAPTRRVDNLVSDLFTTARRLSVHARVCSEAATRYRSLRRNWLLAMTGILLAGAGLAWLSWDPNSIKTSAVIASVCLLLMGACWFAASWSLKKFWADVITPLGIEPFFLTAHGRDLTLRDRADLRDWWEGTRSHTIAALKVLGPGRIPRKLLLARPLKRLERALETDIPQLRREIGQHRTGEKLSESKA